MATIPTSNRQRIDINNPIITRIQVEGNDTVSFLNGTVAPYQYVRGMSQIMPQTPTYISYRYDSITISQVSGDSFTFTIYAITDVGGNTFTPLTFQDSSDVVQAKTIEIYRLLVTSVFKGCCECGNTEPECSIQYIAGNGTDAGTFVYDSGGIRVNYFTANNQDFSGLWPIIQDGSWMFVFSKTDPTVYGVYQLSNYGDGGAYASFDATLLNGPGEFPPGTELCLDVTSVGGSLVQGWQDTLDIDSVLDKDNTVDGGGFNFIFENNDSFTINSVGGSIQTSVSGSSLISGALSVDVGPGYIDVITPGYGTATEGMVLALTAAGHVEYTLAGTGTISSIGLFMPPAFTVSTPNPLTENGEFTVTVEGTEDQYINGLGELATLPVYTVENGLHAFGGVPGEAPPDPFLFHLGGQLIEDTLIETTNGLTQYQLSVRGSVAQNTQFPFGVANLGNGGVATFQDFASGARTNPSVEIVGNNDTYRPLLNLELDGPLPNPGGPGIWENRNSLLSLINTGTTSVGARMAIDYKFRNTSVSPNPDLVFWPAVKLIAEATNITENDEASNFSIRMFDQGSQQDKLLLEGKGQLTLNEYGTGTFTDGTTNIDNSLTYNLAVDGTGKVWKKLAAGGGSVTSVSGTGLITTSPNPITTTGTVTTSMATERLVGRYSPGTGIMQEITIGTGLTLSPTGELTADGGGGGTYDGDQGVYKDTTLTNDTFMLGAPLGDGSTIPFQEAREVDVAENYLYIKGTNTSRLTNQEVLFVEHLAEGIGVYAQSLGNSGTGIGVQGYSDFSVGVSGDTDQGIGVRGVALGTDGFGYAFYGQSIGAYGIYIGSALENKFVLNVPVGATNSVFTNLILSRRDTPAGGVNVGYGISLDFELLESGTYPITSRIASVWANQPSPFDPNNAHLEFSTYGNSTLEVVGRFKGATVDNGQLQLTKYTTATSFAAASGASVGVLNVDNAGNVFVGTGGGGGGTYTVNNGLTENPTDNFQLGGPLIADTSISGGSNTYSLTFDDMNVLSGSSNFKIAFAVNDGTTSSSFELQPNVANMGCGVNGSGSASFAEFTDTQSKVGYSTPTQTVQFGADATGLYVLTPGVDDTTATAGQVLTLVNATTGEAEWADGGGGGGGGGGGRSYYLNGSVVQGTFAGITDMRQMSPVPVIGVGTDFTISTNGYIKSFITDAGDPNKAVIPAGNWNFELWFSANNGGGSPSFYVELYKYDTVALTFTLISSSSANPTPITNGATISLYVTALSVPQTTLALTDRLAVRVFVNNSGRTITLHTQGPHLSQIITDFPSGIVSLNGLTAFAQTFATPGTTGTAPTWSSSTSIHTLNIPLASASGVTAGLISKTEYDAFNGKVGPTRTISTTAPLAGGGNLSADLTLSIADAAADGATKGAAAFTASDFNSAAGVISIDYANGQSASGTNKGFLTSTDWTRFDGFKTQTIGVTVDGSGGVITAGNKGYVRIPYACTISFWSIITTGGGIGASLSFDILRANNAIPVSSIIGGGTKPNVSGTTQLSANTAPSGWTSTTLAANDILAFNVDSGAAIYSWAILQLTITRT